VAGRDRGLEQVRAGSRGARERCREGPVDEREPFRDLDPIPPAPILFFEEGQRSVRADPGVAP